MATATNQSHKPITFVGVDVSKDTLDVVGNNHHEQFRNAPSGFKALIRWLGVQASGAVQILCEATGGYERRLVQALVDAQISVSVVPPARVRSFAKSLGAYAKTDKIDAALLVRFGEVTQPRALRIRDEASRALVELVDFRQQVLDQIAVLKNQLEHIAPGPLMRSSKRILRTYELELSALEKAIDALMKDHEQLWSNFQRLTQVQGVGRYTALSVLAHLPEIGTLSKKQVAALAGLAPYNKDSGNRNGYRSIRGGRKKLRRALYMAALTAAHHNPVLRAFYNQLKERGKASKAALVAVMRKLIMLLNHLIKQPGFSLAS